MTTNIFNNSALMYECHRVALMILLSGNLVMANFVFASGKKINNVILEYYELELAAHVKKIIISEDEITFFVDYCDDESFWKIT